jgi:hypothetical protein
MENMDPQMMAQAAQMLQRLPKGQLQRLQSIMQRAMAGKDVSREAEEFQKTLPPDFQQMMTGFAMAAGAMGGAAQTESSTEAPSGPMTEEEARAIVAKAAAQGKLSDEQAQSLLKSDGGSDIENAIEAEQKGKGLGKLWKNLTGK